MALTGKSDESGTGFISNNTSAPTTIVTNAQGAGKVLVIRKHLVTNIDVVAGVTYTLYKVVGAASAPYGDNYAIIKARNILPSDGVTGTEDIREAADMIIENGDSLKAVAGTASKLKHDTSYFAES